MFVELAKQRRIIEKQAQALACQNEHQQSQIQIIQELNAKLKVANEELIRRLGGRWHCRKCQTPYNVVSSPPKKAGRCDKCGGELYQREDDVPETVKNRREVYLAQTSPLIDSYKKSGKLLEINGSQQVDGVTRDILASLTGADKKAGKPPQKR